LPQSAQASAVFCGAQKTAAMGVPMMATMFPEDPRLGLFTLPLLCYHPVQAAVGGVYASWLRRAMLKRCVAT
jgi:sodium/bile acid cotransporter 7